MSFTLICFQTCACAENIIYPKRFTEPNENSSTVYFPCREKVCKKLWKREWVMVVLKLKKNKYEGLVFWKLVLTSLGP